MIKITDMTSTLIIHPSEIKRMDKILTLLSQSSLKKDHPDVLWIDEQKTGIEQVKKLREFLSFTPFQSQQKAAVILSAHLLTKEAQNALLKTLEEPPGNSFILLGAESENNFLPTVLSRCTIIFLSSSANEPSDVLSDKKEASLVKDAEKLISGSIEQRFAYIEKYETKENLLEGLIHYYRSLLYTKPNKQNSAVLQKLIQAQKWSASNGNTRAILEYLCLVIPNSTTPVN